MHNPLPTRQELVGHFDIRRGLGNIGQGVHRELQRFHDHGCLFFFFIGNIVVSFLGLINVRFKNVVNVVCFSCGFYLSVRILSVYRYT